MPYQANLCYLQITEQSPVAIKNTIFKRSIWRSSHLDNVSPSSTGIPTPARKHRSTATQSRMLSDSTRIHILMSPLLFYNTGKVLILPEYF